MYKQPCTYAEEEYQLSITHKERQLEVQQLIKDETIIPIKASALLRSNKRKPKETFDAYRRGVANASKALKVRLKWGPEAQVMINRLTMEVV